MSPVHVEVHLLIELQGFIRDLYDLWAQYEAVVIVSLWYKTSTPS